MPKYVIEREIPDAGSLTPEQVLAISQKSCSVLKNLGPQIQWLESYVTQDKIYCVYIAPNEAMVREHAKQGGFPANRVSEVQFILESNGLIVFWPIGSHDRIQYLTPLKSTDEYTCCSRSAAISQSIQLIGQVVLRLTAPMSFASCS